jgi:predicted nucleic acid-binding protein
LNYILDTNVASELRKENCNINVRRFVDSRDQRAFFLSAVSIGEIACGVERLPPGEKKSRFTCFLDVRIPEWFEDRIIPVDGKAMREWGRICARIDRTLPLFDALIAATALARGFTVLTRNVRNFEDIEGLLLRNPWEEDRGLLPAPGVFLLPPA